MILQVYNRLFMENEYHKIENISRHLIISITDSGDADIKLQKNCVDILRLNFHDIDSELLNYQVFNEEFACKILNFVFNNIDNVDLILVHCEAGISRSAGVACSLCSILNGNDLEMVKKYPLYNRKVYNTILKQYCNLYFN